MKDGLRFSTSHDGFQVSRTNDDLQSFLCTLQWLF